MTQSMKSMTQKVYIWYLKMYLWGKKNTTYTSTYNHLTKYL